MRYVGKIIFADKISIHKAEMNQTNLLEKMVKFDNKSRPKTKDDKDKKRNTFDSVCAFYEGRE